MEQDELGISNGQLKRIKNNGGGSRRGAPLGDIRFVTIWGNTSIIMISEKLPELMGMCDRLLIMRDGAVSGEFCRKDGYNDRELIERMI